MNIEKYRNSTLLRFLIVGIINTAIGSVLMFLLYNLGHFSYWLSSAVSYGIIGSTSFFLNKYFTFQSRKWSWRQAEKFVLNTAICYIFAYGIAKPLIVWLLSSQSKYVQENVAMVVGVCLYTGLNYIGQKFFAFKAGE